MALLACCCSTRLAVLPHMHSLYARRVICLPSERAFRREDYEFMELRALRKEEAAAGRLRIVAAVAVAILYVLVGNSFSQGVSSTNASTATIAVEQGSR